MKTLAEYYSEKDFRILQERARRIKQSGKADNNNALLEVLLVELHGETYGLPVEGILAIYENLRVTPLPGAPSFIAGIVNLRGNLVIVLNLAVILEIPGAAASDDNALVVVSREGSQVAFLVDRVNEVSEVDARDMTPTNALLNSKSSASLLGVLPNGTVLLNIQQLLNDQNLIVDQASY